MSASDEIARCLIADKAVRVVAAVTTDTAREAARRHGASGGVAAALGRATTAGALLATLTKDVERVTLQMVGRGPLGAITVDASSDGQVRAFVKNPEVLVPARAGARVALGNFVGTKGVLGVARDLGLKEHFSGQTEIVDGEIDTDVEHYLITSEQIDSAIGCEALLDADLGLRVSAGVLLQALPGTEGAPLLAEARQRLRAGLLEELLLPGMSAADLARAVVGPDETLKVLESRPLQFHCPCSRDRATATLVLVGSDLESLLEPDGGATVVCEFCRATYHFSRDTLAGLRPS
jgi:molecular chaperone Hsp33